MKKNKKSGKDFVKIKFYRDPTSEKLDLYEFKTALFDNSNPEEFLLFVRNFQITLKASGSHTTSAKIQYLLTLLHGEAIRQIDTLCVEVGSTNTTHLNRIILGLCTYFFLINMLSKQKRAMSRGMRRVRKLKVRRYTACMIDINKHLEAFPGYKASDKIG